MYLLAWIVVGAVVGWENGRVFQGNGYGPLMDALMGIGGWRSRRISLYAPRASPSYGRTIIATQFVMVGAVLLTALATYINGLRINARQN